MNEADLQWRIIFSAIVAGKSAAFADRAMRMMFLPDQVPFDRVREWVELGVLDEELRFARTGNYGKLAKCLTELVSANINLRTCAPADLEAVHGIGPKTSRFFILWTRPEAKHAALDVHVLRWLRSLGYDAPRSTPQNSTRYAVLEQQFLWEAERRGVTARVLDHAIWVEGAGHPERSDATARLVLPVREAA